MSKEKKGKRIKLGRTLPKPNKDLKPKTTKNKSTTNKK